MNVNISLLSGIYICDRTVKMSQLPVMANWRKTYKILLKIVLQSYLKLVRTYGLQFSWTNYFLKDYLKDYFNF